MPTVEIPYSEDLLLALGQSPQELERDLRFWLAVVDEEWLEDEFRSLPKPSASTARR